MVVRQEACRRDFVAVFRAAGRQKAYRGRTAAAMCPGARNLCEFADKFTGAQSPLRIMKRTPERLKLMIIGN
jgi:hypothetical protein